MPEGRRQRLVFVLGLAPTKIGGIEKFLRLFVLAMDRAGWDTVLCFDGPVSDEFRASVDFLFCFIEAVPHQENLGFAAAGALWRVLRRHRPGRFIYAFHGVMRCFPWLAWLSGCRGISFYDHSSRAPGFVARPLALPKRIVGRILTFPLNLIVSVTEFTRRTGNALGLTSAPSSVVLNGVPLSVASPVRGAALRQRLGIPPEVPVIALMCWMVPVKGVQTLLEAAPRVLAAAPETRFLLVGDGPNLQEYRDLARAGGMEDRFFFTGVISDPTANGVFEAADIYCQPSLWQEASGLAVLEAMSFKLPVVVSRIGGLPELVRDGENGMLFPPGNAAALADRLMALVSDPALRRSMGEAGYQDVAASHRIEQTVDTYVNLILRNGH